jgi:methyl-accepting chemotaxis protein
VEVAGRAGQRLEELVPSIQRSTDFTQEVAAASNEQAAGVAQMVRSMGQVDQITQRTASASEELAAASEEMSAQAEALRQLSDFFVFEATASQAKPPRSPRDSKRDSVRPKLHAVHTYSAPRTAANGGDRDFQRF